MLFSENLKLKRINNALNIHNNIFSDEIDNNINENNKNKSKKSRINFKFKINEFC